MILSAQSISRIRPIEPFCNRTIHNGLSYGLGPASYDVRVAEKLCLSQGDFRLASTIEKFSMPNDISAQVLDKSSWARRGLSLFNTFIDPGWCGYLTLELVYNGVMDITIEAGDPIAQILFIRLDEPTENAYSGKYQNQESGPQSARKEGN